MNGNLKKYFSAACIMGFFAALLTYLPNSLTPLAKSADYDVTFASVRSEIFKDATIDRIKEKHGVRVAFEDKVTYYFEYEANALDTLKLVSSLPFDIDDNASSIGYMLMESNTNPLEVDPALPESVRKATAFFWDKKAEDFTFYECVKSPLKHTLLISKTSSTILHKVELI